MAKAKTNGTTEQQKLFAYAYFNNGGNAAQAAIQAGYGSKCAAQAGSRLLTYANVKKLLGELQDKVKDRALVTKEQIAKELVKVGFSDIRKFFNDDSQLLDIREIPDDAAACLSSVEVDGTVQKIKVWDKLKALSQLTDLYGYNAPSKVAETDKDGNDVVRPYSDEHVDKLIKAMRENKNR